MSGFMADNQGFPRRIMSWSLMFMMLNFPNISLPLILIARWQ
jgi:hypothetical protein